jgi:hypothetical protein
MLTDDKYYNNIKKRNPVIIWLIMTMPRSRINVKSLVYPSTIPDLPSMTRVVMYRKPVTNLTTLKHGGMIVEPTLS